MSTYEERISSDNMNINWYPGHMKKTKELVKDNLKLVDVVIELLDARIPKSSKNPDIDFLVGDKLRVVALNKCDMVEPEAVAKWVEYYKSIGIEAIAIDALKGTGVNKIVEKCKTITKDKMKNLESKGRKARGIRLMIVGVPNVGKSSLINKLSGKKTTQTGDRPGITKGKQWVKLRGNMELLDTPGILWPKFDDQVVALNLAFSRAIKDEILDIETLGLRFIEKISKIEPDKLITRYKIQKIENTPLETMEAIAKKRGFLLGKNDYDYTRTAVAVLNEFREGKLGKICLEFPND